MKTLNVENKVHKTLELIKAIENYATYNELIKDKLQLLGYNVDEMVSGINLKETKNELLGEVTKNVAVSE